jgi:hypothetical protein
MRTTVDIDPELLKRLRAEAHEQRISLKEHLNRVLQRGLAARRKGRPGRYTCPTFSLGTPLRSLDRALALADALEEEEIARKLALRK